MDIIEAEDKTINSQTLRELKEYADEVLQEAFYNEMMTNLSKVEDPNRFSNWYYGNTDIQYPYFDKRSQSLNYSITTSAPSGNISFSLPDRSMKVKIHVTVPENITRNKTTKLFSNIEKISVRISGTITFDEAKNNVSRTFSFPNLKPDYIFIVEKMDAMNLPDIGKTPIFKLSWYYDKEANITQKGQLSGYQEQFVR